AAMCCMLAVASHAQDPAPAPAEAAPAEPPPPPPPPPPQAAEIPIKQVQIEVWISQLDDDGLREVGSNLNYVRSVRGFEQSGSVERVRTNTFDPTSSTFSTILPAPDGSPYRDNVRLTPESD